MLFGKGDGTFLPAIEVPMWGTTNLVAGDFDGDGRPDLAGRAVGSYVAVLHNEGKGTFKKADYYAPIDGYGLAAADQDADGKVDLALTHGGGQGGSLVRALWRSGCLP